jgi:hypothetical protein
LECNPDLALCPITVGWALDLIGRDFERLEPALYEEVCARLSREYERREIASRNYCPTKSWRTTMSPVHAAIYQGCYPGVAYIDDLMETGQLSRRLTMLSEIEPGILAPERWQELARVMPPRLRAIADARTREWGATDATACPVAMISTIESSPIEEILREGAASD